MSERVIDLSVEVPGSVEEVWTAIATGPGITSWFVPHEVEEREGGEVVMDFGPSFGREKATVSAWEPPHRVVFRGPDTDRGPGLAFEWLVEAVSGDICVVRLVNSGFGPGEGDADFDAMTMGWRIFLENLRLHLTHFRGRRARAVIPTVMTPGPGEAAWSTLCAALGVGDDLAPGDRFETSGPGVPALAGRVEETLFEPAVRTYMLLLDAPAAGTAFVSVEGSGDVVIASTHLYLYHGDPADDWFSWLRSAMPDVPDQPPQHGGQEDRVPTQPA